MLVVVRRGSRELTLRCSVARTVRERTRGLRDHIGMDPDEAMWFSNASSIHTFGMRFHILVARVGPGGVVLDARIVPPRRALLPMRRVIGVLECSARADVRAGDVVRFGEAAQAGQPPSPAAPVTIHDPSWFSSARFTAPDRSSLSSLV